MRRNKRRAAARFEQTLALLGLRALMTPTRLQASFYIVEYEAAPFSVRANVCFCCAAPNRRTHNLLRDHEGSCATVGDDAARRKSDASLRRPQRRRCARQNSDAKALDPTAAGCELQSAQTAFDHLDHERRIDRFNCKRLAAAKFQQIGLRTSGVERFVASFFVQIMAIASIGA